MTVTVVCYCPCINIIYLHTDSSAGNVEGQTGTGSLWYSQTACCDCSSLGSDCYHCLLLSLY